VPQYLPSLDNAELLDWSAVEELLGSELVLLLGNGASRVLWEGFSYQSLFAEATSTVEHPLTDEDRALFAEFGGTDFELILGVLLDARRVCQVIGLDGASVGERYESIQRSLREAVGSAHVLWHQIPPQTLIELRSCYRSYRTVYTTNYDLVLYWAVMSRLPEPTEFVDFFWGDGLSFDPWRTDVHSLSATELLYLHGAIHLRRTASGGARKETPGDAGSLLEAFSLPFTADETPLIVTEGASSEKERAIRGSDYLSFAFERLASDNRSLVVFGQALGSQDLHIARAIREGGKRPIGVSIRGSASDVAGRKRNYASRLGSVDLFFFDASSHPLGVPALRINERAPA
jgi:hypothetical protein